MMKNWIWTQTMAFILSVLEVSYCNISGIAHQRSTTAKHFLTFVKNVSFALSVLRVHCSIGFQQMTITLYPQL